MLLQLEDTSYANVKKLLEYARELKLNLRLIDADNAKTALPGKPLSEEALKILIANSRKSGTIAMDTAQSTIRKNFHVN